MTQRRILFVVNHAGFFISHRLPVALAARESGYDVHIATPRSKHVPKVLETGLTWHEIRLSRSSLNPFAELRTLRSLVRLYRRVRPDLVHHVTSKPVLYGTLAARITRVPAVVNAISGLGYAFGETSRRQRMLGHLIGMAYRIVLRHPRMRVIFQNREQLDQFLSTGRVPESSTALIPSSGVDMDVFHPSFRAAKAVPEVVLAARMLYTKGVADLVAAARALNRNGKRARFTLVGEPDPDNPESISLETLRSWDAEEVIHYAGRREDMPVVLATADIFALPSYYAEGVPKALVEAAACGLPIVTTDWPGCRDVVEDGVNGLLVRPRDTAGLAAALARLIADGDLRRSMGAAGRQRAVERFSLAGVVEKTLAIYRDLLA